ncbi:aldose epimerase [filamentous cyanobacterium CCP1]|nr:aldose epimerase [filamentous cyanobacterium CCP2]PSB60021.1 aldose epimerase [filamentous cyanobacterium CCP1]
MFTISQEQRQFKTYILTDDATQARLEVVPERGGIVTQWQVKGHDLLYMDAERFANPEVSIRGGIPILFPICGNLPDNTYTYNGKSYTLKQHGFARELSWTVAEQNTEEGSIALELESSDRTRAVYPFDFHIRFTYQLKENALEIHQTYTNLSSEAMPFSTGLHPYFPVSDKSQLTFDIPATEYLDQLTQTTHPFPGNFDFEQDEIDVAFRDVSRQSASAADASRKIRMAIDYDLIYSTVVFWTVKGKDYYCLEPWTAPRNAFNTGENLIQLEAGSSLRTLVCLRVSFE